MSTNNTFAKSSNFNVNHLKLTPEKLAEWDKRRSSNTLSLSREVTTITSKYFNSSQQNKKKQDKLNMLLEDNSRDQSNGFENEMSLQEDKNTDNDLAIVDFSKDYDIQELNNKISAQEQEFNLISENDKSKILSEEDSSKFL